MVRTALLLVAALLIGASTASAAGSPDLSVTTSSGEVLYGDTATVTVEVSNPTDQPYGYNLSYRAVLPVGVSFSPGSGSPGPGTVIEGPGPGQTTLIWSNLSDLSPGSIARISFGVEHDPSVFTVGDSFVVAVEAFADSDPRVVPQFDPATGEPTGGFTGSGESDGTQQIVAIEVTKSGPGELLRGVHDHQALYKTKVSNNLIEPVTNVVLVDFLPAGLEYLGCGGPDADNTTDAPTNPGSPDEYPGSGPIIVPPLPGCVEPDTIETIDGDPDGPGPLPPGVYTRIVWNIASIGKGAEVELPYRVGIPLRENTMDWTGPVPAPGSLGQAPNLDNNSGLETGDRQTLQSYVSATADFRDIEVSDSADLTTIGHDIIVLKEGSTDEVVEGGIIEWTVTVLTGEYRYATDITVTDTLPNGLCPLGPLNYTTQNQASDSQCDPVAGEEPSIPYASVVENANGTFSISWDPGSAPALAQQSVNASFSFTFPSRVRTNYQSNFNDAGPILTGDSITNSVAVDGTGRPRCTAPGAPNCDPSGPVISNDGLTRPIGDEASDSASTRRPTMGKLIATSGTDCATATYVDAEPSYRPGDLICWKLRVEFPAGVDTSTQVIEDFLPPTVDYLSGSDAPTGNNTVAATLDDSDAANGILSWSITTGTVPPGGQVFERTIATTVNPSGVLAPGLLPGNLLKFSWENSLGESQSLRDQADFTLELPVMDLTKGVKQVNSGPVNGPGVDGAFVKEGDLITYRVDVENTGAVGAEEVEVWDFLPAELECSMVGAISNAGACVTLSGRDRIEWTVSSIGPSAAVELTYQVTFPGGIGPGRNLVNDAGVRQFEASTNTGGSFTYIPEDNIDPDQATPNVPAADDDANVRTRQVTVAKAATTSVVEPGNNLTQATIGETVFYTVTAVIPEGTTLPGGFQITDAVSSRLGYQNDLEVTFNGGALPSPPWSASEASSTPTVTGPAGGYTATGGDTTIVLTFSGVVLDTASNTRVSSAIPNSATATWADPVVGNRSITSPSTSTPVVEPLISTTKANSAGGGFVVSGQVITYTLTTSNLNLARVSVAHDTRVVDTVPTGLTPVGPAPDNEPLADGATVPGTGGAVWDAATRTIARTGVDLNPGGSFVMTYRASVDSPAVAGTELTNSVEADTSSLSGSGGGERTGESPNNTGYVASAENTVTVAIASLEKTVDPATATIGQQVRYTIFVSIPADEDLFDVTVTDTLPASLDYAGQVSAVCTLGCSTGNEITVQPYDPAVSGADQKVAWSLGDIGAAPAKRGVTIIYDAVVRDTFRAGATQVVAGNVATNGARVSSNLTDAVGPFDPTDIPESFDEVSEVSEADVTVTEPSLSLDKQVSVSDGPWEDEASATVGDGFTYRIVVTNTGDSPAFDVVVEDRPDPALTNVQLASGISTSANTKPWTAGDPEISWTVPGPIEPGGSVTLSYTAELVAPGLLSNGQTVENTASVPEYFGISANERESNPDRTYREYADGSDPVTVTLLLPELEIEKTPDGAEFVAGDPTSWKIEVSNTGDATANQVTVTDTLPAGMSYTPGSASVDPVGGFSESSVNPGPGPGQTTIVWVIDQVEVGESRKITLPVDTAPSILASTVLTNTASVVATETPEPVEDTGDRTATAAADLEVTKSGPATGVAGGPNLVYVVTVFNHGPSVARDVVLTDELPPGAAFVSADSGCTEASGTVTCEVGTLGAQQEFSVRVTVSYPPDQIGTKTNQAEATSTTPDPGEFPNRDEVSTLIESVVDVSITKTADPPAIRIGEQVTFTLTVSNAGPSDALEVEIDDPIPAGFEFVSADAGCTYEVSPNAVRCPLGTIAPSQSVTRQFVASAIGPNGTFTNEATVETQSRDSDPDNDRAEAEVEVSPLTDLLVLKRGPARIKPGKAITWILEISNLGPDPATEVVVTDPLPEGVSYKTATDPCGFGSRTVSCELGDLDVGEKVELKIEAKVRESWANRRIRNTARVSGTERESDPDNNRSLRTTKVLDGKPRIKVRIWPKRKKLRPEQTVGVRVRTSNRSRYKARAVKTCVPIPRGFAVVSTGGGRFQGRKVCWQPVSIPRRSSRSYSLKIRPLRSTRGWTGLEARAVGSNTRRASNKNRIRVEAASDRPPLPPAG